MRKPIAYLLFLIVMSMIGLTFSCSPNGSFSRYDSELQENDSDELDESDQQTFHGYECTVDCSGHQAGYNWAEANDITDSANCESNSNSFNEGCKAYVDENG